MGVHPFFENSNHGKQKLTEKTIDRSRHLSPCALASASSVSRFAADREILVLCLHTLTCVATNLFLTQLLMASILIAKLMPNVIVNLIIHTEIQLFYACSKFLASEYIKSFDWLCLRYLNTMIK
jgi:hypothetical protein